MKKNLILIFSVLLSCSDDTTNTPPAEAGQITHDAATQDAKSNDASLPQTGEIIITEFMANPAAVSDGDGEWFEIFNPNAEAIDLSGWTIKDEGSDLHILASDKPILIQPNSYFVLSINSNSSANGGVPVDYQYSGFNLANSSDEIVLLNPSGTTVDRVAYTSSWDVAAGISFGLKDPSYDNDDFSNWCFAAEAWAGSQGDKASPGEANACGQATSCPHNPTKKITFNESLCANIADGTKKITLRNNHWTNISVGEWVKLVCTTSQTTFEGLITVVRNTTWGEITPEEYMADGSSSQEEMMQALLQYYPGITLESNATVFRWDNTTPCN